MKSKANIIVNRIGMVLFSLGVGSCCWHEYGRGRGYPWLVGVGIALTIIGSCMGNVTIHDSKPSAWSSYSLDERDAWFQQSLQSLTTQQPVVTRLMLVNLLVRDMNLPLDEAKGVVDGYCQRNAPQIPLSD